MSNLERGYRTALLCYPRWWREDRREEVLGVLLDSAEAAGRYRADPRDLLNLAFHGALVRLGSAGPESVPGARDRSALLASAGGFALCAVLVLFGELQLWTDAGIALTPAGPVYLAWILAVVLAVTGSGWWSRVLLMVSALALAAVAPVAAVTGQDRPRLWLLLFLVVLTCIAVSGRSAPDRRSQRLLLLLTSWFTVLALAAASAYFLTRHSPYGAYAARDQYNVSYFALAGLGAATVLWCCGRRSWAVAASVNGLVWLSLVLLFPMGTRSGAGATATAAFVAGVLVAGSAVRVGRVPLVREERVEQ